MADLTGSSGSITFGGSDSPVVADVVIVRGRIERPKFRVTRPGYVMHRYSFGTLDGGGIMRVVVTDASVPPIPAGTTGTMVIFQRTAATSQKYTFTAAITALAGIGYNSLTGEQQFVDYEWTVSAGSSSSTVVPSP